MVCGFTARTGIMFNTELEAEALVRSHRASMGTWSKVLLGVLGAAVVITLITVPTVLYLNAKNPDTSSRTFTLDDTFNSTFNYRSYSLRWISDTEYLHKTQDGNVILYNADTKETKVFLSQKTFAQVEATGFFVSADRQYACLESNYTKMWRHSYTASYSIFDITNANFISSKIPHQVQYLSWAPAGNKLAYVWNNNVYVKPQPAADAVQVTINGEENVILNGIPDWVYEEEMFSSNDAMWWSPGGRFLAYAEFNETEVPKIEYSWFGSDQYPQTVIIPYPKAGAPNPTVKLYVVDVTDTSKAEIVVPSSVGSSDHYLSSVTWVTDERIAVQWLKRTQNEAVLQMYDFSGNSWSEGARHTETSSTGWVGRFSPDLPRFSEDNATFYKLMSDSKGYKHLHYVNGTTVTPITSGTWEVISISAVTSDTIYFISNQHLGKPGQRNLYRVATKDGSSIPECLTCYLQEDRCQYNSAAFSRKASYYLMQCYGPGLPMFILRKTIPESEDLILEDNKDLEELLTNFDLPSVQQKTLTLGEFELWYQMILPPKFDKSKKYPLLIDVYAGPCSQKVDYRFRLNWATYLASSENIIVASFDGRGSGYQGDKIMHSIYRRLGTYEVEDQIWAAGKFIDMGYIDKHRIAIWGWSYGGYVTSMVLGSGSGVFKCGMAVAPVSKWEYYDSIYTERYMNRPVDNQEFYMSSTVTARAKNFKSVEYLLVHGTADDNVHFQQAAQISKALVDEQVDFDAMWYTDKDHGLGGSAYRHVYTHMSHFLLKCFGISK